MLAAIFDWPPVWLVLHMAAAAGLAAIWSPLEAEAVLIGLIAIAAGLGLMAWAGITMARSGTTVVPGRAPTTLVTTGPFGFSRNPIYLADLVVLVGWVMVVGQPLGLILTWPLITVLTRRFVEPEERILADRFGDAWTEYAERVDRWY